MPYQQAQEVVIHSVMMNSLSKSDIKQYDKLVRTVVKSLLSRNRLTGLPIEFDDLCQIGWIAVMKCHPKFDPTRGVLFKTFATRAIINEINTEINRFSKKKLHTLSIDVVGEEKEHNSSSSEMMIRLVEVAKKVLDKQELKVFYGKILDEKRFSDIGKDIGYSRETARKIYLSSFDKVKQAINEQEKT